MWWKVTTILCITALDICVSLPGQTRQLPTITETDMLTVTATDQAMTLEVKSMKDTEVTLLQGTVGKSFSTGVPAFTECTEGAGLCMEWPGEGNLRMTSNHDKQQQVICDQMMWEAEDCHVDTLEDCYDMSGSHWYGATQIKSQKWPIEKWIRPSAPYVTGDSMNDEYGGVQERYWLSSNGVAFFIDWETPLWVSMNFNNDNQLCFKATYKNSPYINHDDSPLSLNYTVCQGTGLKEIHNYMLESYIGKPNGIPDERMFRDPIWSTWAQFKEDVNQSLVMDYAHQIRANQFTDSQLEIDDHWESSYGRLDFNFEKFPDPAQMVADLKEMGFRTTMWVHPFCDITSDYLWEGGLRFVFMRDLGQILPALTIWWQGVATITDFTSTRATDWWTSHLTELKSKYGVDSFKFDAGETNWLPAAYHPGTAMRNPSDFTTYFAEMAYSMDTDVRHQEVRVGARTQHLPIFVRMMDKDSRWDDNNGLTTIIPHALTYSIIGYPFILPDMIGGNAYDGNLPDRELFIRWVELNALLPGFQFSIAPWQYDAEVVEISRNMVQLHQMYASLMITLAHEATETGAPIIRPLWWIAPDDEEALINDSQFLLGDNVLVAPVQEQGANSRHIYFPVGTWKDENTGQEIEGPVWVQEHPAPLNILPYFTRETQ